LKEKLEKEIQVSFVKRTTSVILPKVNRELASRLQSDVSFIEESGESSKMVLKLILKNIFLFRIIHRIIY